MCLTKELKEFVTEQRNGVFPRSREFVMGPLTVYLRAGAYINNHDEGRTPAVALARIDVALEEQRKGHFSAFLTELEAFAESQNYYYTRVEQVMNEHLRDYLLKSGYVSLHREELHEHDEGIYVKLIPGVQYSPRYNFEQALIKSGKFTRLDIVRQFDTLAGDSSTEIRMLWEGYQLAMVDYVGVQDAWQAAGGNPGIKADKDDLLTALRLMNEAEDEADAALEAKAAKPKTVRVNRVPVVDTGERIRRSFEVSKKTINAAQAIGKKVRTIRLNMNVSQSEFGALLGTGQTEVSSIERGVITKRKDGGEDALKRAEAFLVRVNKYVGKTE